MTFGLVQAFGLVHSRVEQSTSRHGHLQAQCSVALPVGFVFSSWFHCMEMGALRTFPGLKPGMWYWFLEILWVAYPIFMAYSRKLGNRRSSEGLRSFKPSGGTNLLVLIILAGDIEMNPGPRSQCRQCKKYCKATEKVVKCEECRKCFHVSCAKS